MFKSKSKRKSKTERSQTEEGPRMKVNISDFDNDMNYLALNLSKLNRRK